MRENRGSSFYIVYKPIHKYVQERGSTYLTLTPKVIPNRRICALFALYDTLAAYGGSCIIPQKGTMPSPDALKVTNIV